MKIKSISARLEKLPLTKPYTIAYKNITDTEIIFLEIVLENGINGIGAANPFEEVVGETPAQTLANLQTDFVHQFVGRDIRHFNQLIDEANTQFPHLPGTVAAIDLALHDAFCQYIGIAVVDFLGRKHEALPTSVTIGIKEHIEEMVEEAIAYQAAGFRVIKLKTGLNVEADIESVFKLHKAIGSNMRIRVDANQGYNLSQLKSFLQATKKLSIELIEQPLQVGHDIELLQLHEEERNMLVADESLLDATTALQFAHQPKPYGIFNIKLMKSGGISGAKEIANIAQHAGIQLFWGCNDESMASIAAALQVAYSCPNTKYLDLDGSFDLSRDWVTDGFFLEDGLMYCNSKPGLGLKRIGE
jgi:L-alanine-DL-glutamate epimerase-like enolase superfamily enzyme